MRTARGMPCGPRLIAQSLTRVGIKRPRRRYGRLAPKRKSGSRLEDLVPEQQPRAQAENRCSRDNGPPHLTASSTGLRRKLDPRPERLTEKCQSIEKPNKSG